MFFSFALSLSIVLLIISRALARAAYTIEMMGFSPLLFRLHFYFFSLSLSSVMLWAKESEWLRLCAALIVIIYACWGETKRKREREALFTYDDDRVALFNYYYFLFHYYLLMVVVVVVVDHILYYIYYIERELKRCAWLS